VKIVLIHQNFPGQYRHLIPILLKQGHHLIAISQVDHIEIEGVANLCYSLPRGNLPNQHPYLISMESALLRAEAVAKLCQTLKNKGYTPDLILGHSGWGETLFLKDIWSQIRLVTFFEYFYHASGTDIDFDPEFPPAKNIAFQLRVRNSHLLSSLSACDQGITATQWQYYLFPKEFRSKLAVIHEGIDTDIAKPNREARIHIKDGNYRFSTKTPLITFVNRNLEPTRGYHQFLRALVKIQQQHRYVQTIIIGGDDVSYSPAPQQGISYKQQFLNELDGQLDLSRIHFVGKVPYNIYINLLQISTVHVYLSYPFVLSWSLMEAMSIGCRIVASDTAPVKELITDQKTGLLVDFFSSQQLSDSVGKILKQPMKYQFLGKNARRHITKNYDFRRVILKQHLELIGI
jgi:glycosyltransferase involved in cell wall biosynthesis